MTKNFNLYLLISGFLGLISVMMGALLDHAFSSLTETQINSMETAIRYNMLYAILSVVLAIHVETHKKFKRSLILFLSGMFTFSFCIYLGVLTPYSFFLKCVPIGGLTLMIGWVSLIIASLATSREKPKFNDSKK